MCYCFGGRGPFVIGMRRVLGAAVVRQRPRRCKDRWTCARWVEFCAGATVRERGKRERGRERGEGESNRRATAQHWTEKEQGRRRCVGRDRVWICRRSCQRVGPATPRDTEKPAGEKAAALRGPAHAPTPAPARTARVGVSTLSTLKKNPGILFARPPLTSRPPPPPPPHLPLTPPPPPPPPPPAPAPARRTPPGSCPPPTGRPSGTQRPGRP